MSPLLNTAGAVYLGAQPADAIYLGAERIWPVLIVTGSYADEVLADNPLGHWRLGETSGTVAVDASGRRNGTYTGSPTLGVPSTLVSDANKAMQVSGATGQGMRVANHADYQIDTLTLEAWVKTTGAGSSFRSIVVKQDAYAIFAIDGMLGTYVWSTATIVNTGVSIQDGNPHHVAVVLRGGVANGSQFYRDGVPVGPAFTYTTANHNAPLDFGYNPAAGQEFIGVIDEGAIYPTALSAGRVAVHYAAGIAPAPPSFAPSDLTGLTVWLDASQLGLADGASVMSWPNLGAGANPTIVPGVAAPPLTMKTGMLNGLPVVRFTVSGSRVRGGWTSAIYEWTVIYLCRLWGANVGRAFSVQYPPSNLLIGMHTTAMDTMYDNGTWLGGATWSPGPLPWRMYGGDSQGGIGSRFFINGVQIGPLISGVGGFSNGWGLSGYDATGAPETMDLDVAEMVIYDRKLADAERQQVEGYLRDKWGLT